MPGLNRKGPAGEGAMTGRRLGRCQPENKGKTDNEILQNQQSSRLSGQGRGSGPGRGLGLGRGLKKGRGFRRNS
ncbi:MAG: DUF5320 domain-containing protein [Mangrovibacterium sp.]